MDKDHLWQILRELRHELELLYGDRLAEVILYGSQARGDATPDSDIDVLVVLKNVGDFEKEREELIPIIADISLKYDVLVSSLFMPLDRYRYGQSALLANIHRDKVPF